MLLSTVRLIEKNHVIFEHQSNLYYCALNNDNKLRVFSPTYMNIMLEQFHDTIGPVTFHDIVQISVLENRNEEITVLPNKLRCLTILSTMCSRFELTGPVCDNIEEISIDKSNITVFPNIRNCKKLRVCRFNHSAIAAFHVDYPLPSTLKELNLQTNLIKNNLVDQFSYDKLYEPVVEKKTLPRVNLSDNYLTYDHFPEKLRMKCNLVRQGTYKHNRIHFANVGQVNVQNFMQNQHLNTDPGFGFFSSQNVHLSSINSSVHESVKKLVEYKIANEIPVVCFPNFISVYEERKNHGSDESVFFLLDYQRTTEKWYYGLMNTYKWIELPTKVNQGMTDLELFVCFFQTLNHDLQTVLIKDFNLASVNSITKLSYKSTFELIWSIVCHLYRHPPSLLSTTEPTATHFTNITDCFERFMIEIDDGKHVCFTGKYNRLLNTVVGIINGVRIGISEGEELQLEFSVLVKKIQANTGNEMYTFSMAYCEAQEILKTVESKDTRDTWMTAVLDLAPDPEPFIFEGKEYLRGWDDTIYDIYGKVETGYYMEESKEIHWLNDFI